jgi:hypothetical protein
LNLAKEIAVTNCTLPGIEFPGVKKRKVQADFSGGDISSDGGVLLLRQADRLSGLTNAVVNVLQDERAKGKVKHDLLSLFRQRVYGLTLGYEDLNDHDFLRSDLAFQTAVEKDHDLASSPTLCRFENRADRETAIAIHQVLIEQFISTFKKPPTRLVLDFDATDDAVHGKQVGRFFHGYYDHYCFLPLYVFCGHKLLVAYLRPSNIDGAKHSWAILSLLVKRLKKAWPEVKITFRGDSGFCRHRILEWCDINGVDYIVGLAKNRRLNKMAGHWMEQAKQGFEQTQLKQRLFGEFQYSADSWKNEKRVIARIEHSQKGANPRYVVTNLPGDAKKLYEKLYCARGDMENRIKEQQLDLFADRTSCSKWWPNQFRLLLASLAYCLIETIRRIGLKGTELAKAQCGTIRLKLFKIGAVIIKNTRRVRLMLASSYPYQSLFRMAAANLKAG